VASLEKQVMECLKARDLLEKEVARLHKIIKNMKVENG